LHRKQRLGEPVKFGDTIQLQHALSRKFITVQSFETAESEHQNLKVQLDPLGNDQSHLKFMARLRIDEVSLLSFDRDQVVLFSFVTYFLLLVNRLKRKNLTCSNFDT